MEMNKDAIAAAIESARQSKKISYRQLAELSGRDTRAVQAVCKGKYSYGIDTLLDIVKALGLEIILK